MSQKYLYKNRNAKKGFITAIILIVVALILLGYFRINIQDVLTGPVVRQNLQYAWQTVVWAITTAYNTIVTFISTYIHF